MEDWEKIESIFNNALKINLNARAEYVAEKCGSDKHLKHQVLILLDADSNSDHYLSNLSDTLYPLINDIEIDRVKHYQLLDKIGEGGMGVVYKAFDEKLQRIVAIKFLLSYRARNSNDKQRFMHEATAAAGLNHPNVCKVYEIDETEDGRLFIVTSFCQGKNLSELIAEKNLTIGNLIKIIIQLCGALKAAHDNDIVHRDLKPENIIVTDDWNVQLVDFGIAKTAGTDISQTGQIIGTFAYMSPEQFSGGVIDHRTDIWALGVLLFESFTGERPFKGENAAEIMYQIFNNSIPHITNNKDPLLDRINHIIQRCLCIEKQRRFHKIDLLNNELNNILSSLIDTNKDYDLCQNIFHKSILSAKSTTASKKAENIYNEYRKILTLGIVYNKNNDTIKELAHHIKQQSGKVYSDNDKTTYNNGLDLLIAHFGFPLFSEKTSNSILNCVKLLLDIPHVDKIVVHNMPVVVSDNNKTGQRQLLGDIRGSMQAIIDAVADSCNPPSNMSVIVSESASTRLRKRLPSAIKIDSNLNNNESVFILDRATAESLLSPSRDQYSTQLMGRYHELGLLESAWKDTCDGDSRAALITGEAGMGKTRLVHELTNVVRLGKNIKNTKHLVINCTFDPLQQDTAFSPIIGALSKNIYNYSQNEKSSALIDKDSVEKWLSFVFSLENNLSQKEYNHSLNSEDTNTILWMLEKANLIKLGGHSINRNQSAESLKNNCSLLFNKILNQLTMKQPVLLIFEDLHWADFSSLEWIDKLLSKPLPSHLFIVMTGRPELFHRWHSHSNITQLSLNKLGISEINDFIHSLDSKTLLSKELKERIIEKTAGNPLFIEEYVNMLAKQLEENHKDIKLDNLNLDLVNKVPESLDEILLSKLDVLGHSKIIAQAASTIGRVFGEELLRNLLEFINVDYSNNISKHLAILNEADIIFNTQNNQFVFKHALIRDALYQTISTEQQKEFHSAIANILKHHYQSGDSESEERIAQHFSLANDHQESIQWWLKAAKIAWASYALVEVTRLCKYGINDLNAFKKSNTQFKDTQQLNDIEIELHMLLGRAAMAVEGYASNTAANAHKHAVKLASTPEEKLFTFPSLIGIWANYCVSAQHVAAEGIAQELIDISEQYHSEDLAVEAYMLRGTTHLFRGNFTESFSDLSIAKKRLTLDMSLPHIDAYGQDPAVVIYSFFAILKESTGDNESALSMSQKAIDSARRSQHPFSLSFALGFSVHIHIRLRKNEEAQKLLDENKHLCIDHGIHVFRLLGTIQEGILNIATGKVQKGTSILENSIPEYQAMGANLYMGTWHGILALTCLKIGEPQRALKHLNRGITAVNTSGERISQGVLAIAAQHLNITPEFTEPLLPTD